MASSNTTQRRDKPRPETEATKAGLVETPEKRSIRSPKSEFAPKGILEDNPFSPLREVGDAHRLMRRQALREIARNPGRLDLRSAYATFVEKSDAARARFIRLQLEAAAAPSSAPGWLEKQWSAREMELLHGARWIAEELSALGGGRGHYRRGFVEHLEIDASEFLRLGAGLLERAPIEHLTFTGVKPVARDLFESELLHGIRSLDLSGNGLDDADIEALAESAALAKLHWLLLAGNRIGLPGVERLAAATRRGAIPLEHADFTGNPMDPVERAVHDMDTVISLELPPESRELERAGPIPWLHRAVRDGQLLPVSRYSGR